MMIFMIFMIHTFSPFSYYAPWCPWYPCFLCLLCLRLPRSSRNCSVSICHNLPSVDMWHPMAHGSRYGPARSMPFSHASQFRYLQTFRETLDIRSRRNDDSGRYQIYQMSCIEQMFRCQNRQILGKDKDIADIADIHVLNVPNHLYPFIIFIYLFMLPLMQKTWQHPGVSGKIMQ